MSSKPDKKLPVSRQLAYAAPAFALAAIGIPVYVYIPKYYTDYMGVNIMIVGYLLLAIRLFDAITDPIIGVISDRTRSRFGRRRPYIAGGSILVAIAVYGLFNPPALSPTMASVWFGLWLFFLFFFWTVVIVPYESLGPELTFDYNERTSLFALRDGMLIAGTLAAASLPALLEYAPGFSEGISGERFKFFTSSVFYGVAIVLCCWFCVGVVPETGIKKHYQGHRLGVDFSGVLKNRPFIILLAAYTISAFGNNLPATLILYYVEYVLQSSLAEVFLFVYFLTGILFLPLWIQLSKRIGKRNAWLFSMGLNTGAFAGVFFLGAGDVWLYGVLIFFSGIGFGASLALPSAIQADVIDFDEMLTGERREGQYVGLWSIAKKLAAALGVGVGLAVLGSAGYEPQAQQSDGVLFALRVMYALIPSICNLIAMAVILAYPIDRKAHQKIRQAIDDRRAQAV